MNTNNNVMPELKDHLNEKVKEWDQEIINNNEAIAILKRKNESMEECRERVKNKDYEKFQRDLVTMRYGDSIPTPNNNPSVKKNLSLEIISQTIRDLYSYDNPYAKQLKHLQDQVKALQVDKSTPSGWGLNSDSNHIVIKNWKDEYYEGILNEIRKCIQLPLERSNKYFSIYKDGMITRINVTTQCSKDRNL